MGPSVYQAGTLSQATGLVGKDRLANALFLLLAEHPYSRISVGDICAAAGVSRQTFYRHFENKDAVAKWFFYQKASLTMYRVGRDMSWHESIVQLLSGWESNIDLVRELFRGDGYESVKMHAFRSRVESLRETCRLRGDGKIGPQLDFQIRFYARAEVEILISCLLESGKMPDGFAEYLESCVPAGLHDLLDVSGGPTAMAEAGQTEATETAEASEASEAGQRGQ